MTPDELRAAIARDCPHRIDRLYRAAQASRTVWRARRLITKAARIRDKILEGLK